MLENYHRCIS